MGGSFKVVWVSSILAMHAVYRIASFVRYQTKWLVYQGRRTSKSWNSHKDNNTKTKIGEYAHWSNKKFENKIMGWYSLACSN